MRNRSTCAGGTRTGGRAETGSVPEVWSAAADEPWEAIDCIANWILRPGRDVPLFAGDVQPRAEPAAVCLERESWADSWGQPPPGCGARPNSRPPAPARRRRGRTDGPPGGLRTQGWAMLHLGPRVTASPQGAESRFSSW